MPIRYRIDPARRLVHLDLYGKLTADEIRDFRRSLDEEPGGAAVFDRLIDARGLSRDIDPAEIRRLADVVRTSDRGKEPSRRAVVMDDAPLTCTPETEIDEVRRMMLGRHARYMPVITQRMLMGVISFYDVAKAVVEGQDFENRMLKAYIRDWPVEDEQAAAQQQQ